MKDSVTEYFFPENLRFVQFLQEVFLKFVKIIKCSHGKKKKNHPPHTHTHANFVANGDCIKIILY